MKRNVESSARQDERGVTAVEYALVVGSIVLFIIVGVAAFGPALAEYVGTLNDNF